MSSRTPGKGPHRLGAVDRQGVRRVAGGGGGVWASGCHRLLCHPGDLLRGGPGGVGGQGVPPYRLNCFGAALRHPQVPPRVDGMLWARELCIFVLHAAQHCAHYLMCSSSMWVEEKRTHRKHCRKPILHPSRCTEPVRLAQRGRWPRLPQLPAPRSSRVTRHSPASGFLDPVHTKEILRMGDPAKST